MADINISELSVTMKRAVEFIASAAVGGVIGNRADHWFGNLYYHQKKRIVQWLSSLKLTRKEQEQILSDERLKTLFSQVTHSVANEIFDRKILIWPTITESLIRNTKYEFDKKVYFIDVFIKLQPFTIHFLASLYVRAQIPYKEIYPSEDRPPIGDKNYGFFLGHMQAESLGFADAFGINITDLGKEFVDFISNSFLNKVKEFAAR